MRSILNTGQKNSRLLYFLNNLAMLAVPGKICRGRLDRILSRIDEHDPDDIHRRVNYCNQSTEPFKIDRDAVPVRFNIFRGRSNYYSDLYEYARYFDPAFRVRFVFGDVTEVPEKPTLVKARPIHGANRNSILFNLNKVRHFVFINDRVKFEDKISRLVWRGHAFQENRKRFLQQYFNHPGCEVGHAHKRKTTNPWQKPYLSIREQLKYKFILSLEGNDVASNLKWIMSSNSVCFMPRPRFETWFMEGTLAPDHHYVLLKDDFSDLEEKIEYYAGNMEKAQAIIENAHDYVVRFRDADREDLVSLLVLKRYFEMSGQWPGAIQD